MLMGIFLLWMFGGGIANGFSVVEQQFFWSSSNLTEADPIKEGQSKKSVEKGRAVFLGDFGYKAHFNLYGAPPPLSFLTPLKAGEGAFAKIENSQILFRKTGKKIPLNISCIPSGANAASPYLLSLPKIKRILVVYPYYFYQDKENKFMTEVYSDQGTLLSTFDSLPTHMDVNNPYLLVSPEKTGCCESLRWSIRFYNLRKNSVSEYSCPEGFCGDSLFTKLGGHGPFIIVQEILGKIGEVGASMQTNYYVVENDGSLSASGKTLYALKESYLDQKRLESLSPYFISNLVSIEPLSGKRSWLLLFGAADKRKALKLISNDMDLTPSPVFLLPKDPSIRGMKGIKMEDRHLGKLPLLGVTQAGWVSFTISSEGDQEEKFFKEIRSDFVNILVF